MNDLHGAAAEHEARAQHDRVADAVGGCDRFLVRAGDGAGRLLQANSVEQLREEFAVFGEID